MDKNADFLILLRDYKWAKEALEDKAWEITPDDIKEMLYGKSGLFREEDLRMAKEWLIRSRWEFSDKSCVDLILEGRNEEVKTYITHSESGTYT